MKRISLFMILISGMLFWFSGCNKKEKASVETEATLKSREVLPITIIKTTHSNGKTAAVCDGVHGGEIGLGSSWEIATCKSNCDHGIGFRCGRETYAICRDGSHQIVQQNLGSCNGGGVIIYQPGRSMDGIFEFYDNRTAKIIFQNGVPEKERNNNIFELEDNPNIEMPENILIGGVFYNYIRFVPGNYTIDYSDGRYGSVIVNVELIP
jgi:hypothetical protein